MDVIICGRISKSSLDLGKRVFEPSHRRATSREARPKSLSELCLNGKMDRQNETPLSLCGTAAYLVRQSCALACPGSSSPRLSRQVQSSRQVRSRGRSGPAGKAQSPLPSPPFPSPKSKLKPCRQTQIDNANCRSALLLLDLADHDHSLGLYKIMLYAFIAPASEPPPRTSPPPPFIWSTILFRFTGRQLLYWLNCNWHHCNGPAGHPTLLF